MSKRLAYIGSLSLRQGPAGLLGALALTFLAPFVYTVHRFPLAALDSELVAALCLAFGLVCGALLERRDAVLDWPLPAALLLFTAIAWVQQASGLLAYPELAIRWTLFLAAVLAAYALGRQVVAAGLTREATGALAAATLAGGLFSVLVQWLQLFDAQVLPSWLAIVYPDEAIQQRPFANLAQSNQLATYLAMAALSAVYLGPRARRLAALALGLCLLASGLALTGSRMAMLFVALNAAAVLALPALRPASPRDRWIAAASLTAGYAAGLIALRTVVGQFDTLTRLGQHTLPIRLELWQQAWRIALAHPWLGVGVGQFGYGQLGVARPGPFLVPAHNAHNVVLQFAAELGRPAALAVAALGLYWGLRDLRTRLALPEHALAIGMMLMIAIHSLLEYPLWHLYFAVPAALLFALAEPGRGAGWAIGLQRVILPAAGVTMIAVAVTYHLEYGAVADAASPLWLETQHLRARTPRDALAVLEVAGSALFRPEVDRLLLDLKHAPDEAGGGPLERSARLLHLLPAPEVIAQRIDQLARAGRIDESIVQVERLRAFAAEGYGAYRDWLLDDTRELGAQAAPLRRALREAHAG